MLRKKALLMLEDRNVFSGISFGETGTICGEIVFNTAMSGYQEILTDPSYANQIITLTSPHVGNVGTNAEDEESEKIWAKGLIAKSYSATWSNWRAGSSLHAYLQKHHTVGIANIDTRRLTRLLRDKGVLHGCVTTEDITLDDALKLIQLNKANEAGDLIHLVGTKKVTILRAELNSHQRLRVVVYDFGAKKNILQHLQKLGCELILVPPHFSKNDTLRLNPDGILLSNGPGDPGFYTETIEITRQLLTMNIPIFGICLGYQLLALACGAATSKLKFGHHGANHPVININTQKVYITTQNHNFKVDENSLPAELTITHRSLFDNSIQGLKHEIFPAFGFQGHPEAGPGPNDMKTMFCQFIEMIKVKVKVKLPSVISLLA
jgi:carbamoyl-phosphate synthase small subunit